MESGRSAVFSSIACLAVFCFFSNGCTASNSGPAKASPVKDSQVGSLSSQPTSEFPKSKFSAQIADVPLPSFTVTHQESGLATIVVDKSASDIAIERLIWQLRMATRDRQFDGMKISQTLIDERDPTFYFQIYRGSRCSEENRSKGAVTCNLHMHDVANYLLGSFASKDSESATLYHGDEETRAEELFGPSIPPPATLAEFLKTKRPIEGESHLSQQAEVIQQFNQSGWAGGRKAVFTMDGNSKGRIVATADWLVSSDNTKLMQMGLNSRRAEACAAGFTEVRLRPFLTDTGILLNLRCKRQ